MIIKNDAYWIGDCFNDIEEYLKAYEENEELEVKEIVCSNCKGKRLLINVDDDEGVIQVVCPKCHYCKLLLDSEEYVDDADLIELHCGVCNEKVHNVGIGFTRRKDKNIKKVSIGVRCEHCGALGCCGEWGINYVPTDEMERNI